MIQLIMLIISAALVSGSAAFFSIFGLAHTFPFAMISLIILGSGLELSKLSIASFAYIYWKNINFIAKSLTVFFMTFLMVLTSIGIFGYLNAAYQSGAINGKEISQKIELLTEQKNQYETQIIFIDAQIEKSPEKFVSKKIELIKLLQKDKQQIIKQLENINIERNKLLNTKITADAKLGPITFIAEAFKLPVDNAIAYLIGLIMIVFDPLAIYLTILVNIVLKHMRDNKLLASKEIPPEQSLIDSRYEDLRDKVNNIDDSHPRKQNIIANSRLI